MVPCLFDLSVDANETTDIGSENPALLMDMWRELNDTWLGYYHSRSPADMKGVCNSKCATTHWMNIGGKGATIGPFCGVPGCDTPGPAPSPPSPAPERPRFKPQNFTNCTQVPGARYNARVPDEPSGVKDVESAEDCCRKCFEDVYCVASAWHGPKGSHVCFLHYSTAGSTAGQNGVLGLLTGRPNP